MSDDSQFVIRPVTSEDEPYLLTMMRALVEQEPNPGVFHRVQVRSSLHHLLVHPERGRIWLLLADEKPAGYIVLSLGFSFEYLGTDAFIDELFIAPEFRRRGFGKRALLFVEAEAKRLGVNALHLEVDRGNQAAFELYRRNGYKDQNRILMTKWLQHPQ